MTRETLTRLGESRYVHANGTDIHYVEAGTGVPLLLLHGGMVSNDPLWDGIPVAYVSHVGTFAQHFRVIAPDTRGHGKTINTGGGPVLYSQLADDVVALIDALDLDRPLICGFSDGGHTATIVGIRNPGTVRAIVNDAGYDLFNPNAPSMSMTRQLFGGATDATHADPDAVAQFFDASDDMRPLLRLVQADLDTSQGAGAWRSLFVEAFDRLTQSPGYTVADLQRIAAPALIMAGDRDHFCSIEEGLATWRMLQFGELAIVPGTGHLISPLKVQICIDFLRRHAA